ncbi:MAG: hypothetical protein HDS20_03845 [Bacteroides sp.]|nr:hypothetical protein [Bacteroides sp.]
MNSTAPSSTPDLLTRARDIFSRANDLRLHDPATPSSPQAAITRGQAARWIDQAIQAAPALSASEALQTVQAIDLLHRIAHSLPAPTTLTNPLILQAFNALIHGDQTITPYDLFPHINQAIQRRDPAFLGAPLRWHSLQVAAWLQNFKTPRRPKIQGQDLKTQSRLLLQTDLSPFLPSPSTLLPLLQANSRS